jgi:DNA-binding transcriptional regulator YdaS (Cro superfamily)
MRPTRFKRALVAGFAAAVVAGAAIGVAAAQQTPTPTPNQQQQNRQTQRQNFLAALAKRLNISVDQLNQAIAGARQDVGLPPPGQGGQGKPGGIGRGFGRGLFAQGAQTVASTLGISTDQLRQELPGKSLAQVAQAHGKSAQDLITALTNAANQHIDQAVSSGRLTADQGNQMKSRLAQNIPNLVNRTWPAPGQNGRPGANEPSEVEFD